jgi:hypothetical protein
MPGGISFELTKCLTEYWTLKMLVSGNILVGKYVVVRNMAGVKGCGVQNQISFPI